MASTSKGFDFGSDDVLCTYDDFNGRDGVDASTGTVADSVVAANSNKDFNKSRMARSSYAPSPTFKQPEETLIQEITNAVDRSMKKNSDNIMRFLEGISSRLSQLELYCYNVDKSVGEMRSELVRDHEEVDSKLKTLEKHIEEVHRSVQILRDKQELADTQKELAKLQLAQKESGNSSQSQENEEMPPTPAVESQKVSDSPDFHNQQLALALPHQIPPSQPSLPPRTAEPPSPVVHPSHGQPQNVLQQQHYYLPPTELQAQVQPPQGQGQYGIPDSQYRQSQLQDMPQGHPQPLQSNVNQPTPPSQAHHFPHYQQQWPQQLTPQQLQLPLRPPIQPQQQPSNPTHIRTQPGPGYSPYQASRPASPAPDTIPSSIQLQFSGSPSGMSRTEAVPYGYGARPIHQQPPAHHFQQLKGNFGGQANDGYANTVPHSGPTPPGGYIMYGNEEGRPPPQPHFSQGVYPPNPMALNPNQSQFGRNHPYNDLIEKLVNMGFKGDHVLHVIQSMEDSGQPIDFNTVLDRLSAQSFGASHGGGWSA